MYRILLLHIFLFLGPSLLYSQDEHWEVISEMPVPVYGGTAVTHDSLIYILGGYSDSLFAPVNIIQAYEPSANRWNVLEDTLQIPRFGFASAMHRDELVIAGGTSTAEKRSDTMERWDFEGATVISDSNYNFNRKFTAAAADEDILYIFGGYPDYRWVADSLEMPYIFGYDLVIESETYSNNELYYDSSLDGSLPYQQMPLLFDGNIYIFGGAHNGILIDVFRFDLSDKSWRPVFPALFEERAAAAVVRVDEQRALIIGGYNESNEAMASTEHYYPNYNYSELGLDMHFPRKELMAAVYNDAVYVFGGRDQNGSTVTYVEKIDIKGTTSIRVSSDVLPGSVQLYDNYPNPFNGATTIRYSVGAYGNTPQRVQLTIHNIIGEKIATLVSETQPPGEYAVRWNASNMPTGIYYCKMTAKSTRHTVTDTRKMMLLR